MVPIDVIHAVVGRRTDLLLSGQIAELSGPLEQRR